MSKWSDKYKKAVSFSYDDGVYQDIRLVNLLNRYGLKCTFNLNSGLMSPDSVWYGDGVRVERMPPVGLCELYEGHEIASHTTTHRNMRELDSHTIYTDVKKDIAALEKIFDCTVSGFAYPFGDTDARVKEVLKTCGVKYARGVKSTHRFDLPSDIFEISPTCRHKEECIFELAEEFIQMKPTRPQIFFMWGHSYEFDMQDGWERFEKFCKLISGHDDIFYGTCSEVFLNF